MSTEIINMIREMRLRRMTCIIATQDPEAVEPEVHKLSTITIVHKTRSIQSLKALRSGNGAWNEVTIEALSSQGKGDVHIAVTESSQPQYMSKAQPGKVRPTSAMPGGTTQTAVPEDT